MKERKRIVVFDIDNTIVDTAYRKKSILEEVFGADITLSEIREDFWLENYFGASRESKVRARFYNVLESVEGIKNYPAPLLDREGIIETLDSLRKQGVEPFFLSSRPLDLLEVTYAELNSLGLLFEPENVILCGSTLDKDKFEESCAIAKAEAINSILNKFEVLALVGDRPSDVKCAIKNQIPAILIKSTVGKEEVKDLRDSFKNGQIIGFFECESWSDIGVALETNISGQKSITSMREEFIEQYANWLGDIDSKIRTTVSIAAVLSALSGKILMENSTNLDKYDIPLCICFFLSVLSMIFSIRGFTSRTTSGDKTGIIIKTNFKQLFGILFGVPKNWMHHKGDAIEQYDRVINYSNEEKKRAHLIFFNERYKTLDSGIIRNMRLFELRKANYQKLYAERIASGFLVFSLVSILIWFFVSIAIVK